MVTAAMTEAEEDAILAQAKEIQKARDDRYHQKAQIIQIRAAEGDKFEDSELIYAAFAKCVCGAGYAYPKNCDMFHYWDCADILTNRAQKDTKHSDRLSFSFYDVKSEQQPSANGATTRPKQEA